MLKKGMLYGIPLLLVALLVWFVMRAPSDTSDTANAGDTVDDGGDASAMHSGAGGGDTVSVDDEQPNPAMAEDMGTPSTTVGSEPLTVEARDAEDALTADAIDPASNSDVTRDGAEAARGVDQPESADAAARGGEQRVVVPKSFPASDAAKYFVPKEERGPGNLGGPPPMDFLEDATDELLDKLPEAPAASGGN